MDRELVAEKLELLRRCVVRIEERCPERLSDLEKNLDYQASIFATC
jgi:predicted GNAT family acetyltransferase